jgi:hypothetical protein
MNDRSVRTLLSLVAIGAIGSVLLSSTAFAFVGPIAVGLGRMNEVGEIETSFAADATLETQEMSVDTRINYQPGMVRDAMQVGGREMVTIRRFDLGKIWMMMGPGMYMEIAADQGSEQAPDYKLVSREIVGPETVNGMKTTKYKSVYETQDGKFGGFTWYTDDHIAVKGFLVHEIKGEKQRLKFEIKNLERGEQPDSLFEVPEGARKINMQGFPGIPSGPGGAAGAR